MRTTCVLTVVVGLLLFAQPAAAQYRYAFAGIQDTASEQTVQAKLSAIGFALDQTDADGDQWFEGTLLGVPTQIIAILTPARRIAKIIVNIQTPDEDAFGTYARMVGTLTEKYGAPASTIEEYAEPYTSDSGNREEAVREGKASIASLWSEGDDADSGVMVQVSARLTVEVIYEYPAWSDELARREAAQLQVF